MIQGIYRPRSHQLTLWHVDSSVTGTSGERSKDGDVVWASLTFREFAPGMTVKELLLVWAWPNC
jgi:hypothetical protein